MRKDLKPGLQLAQSCHAAFQFAKENYTTTLNWMEISNYICVVSAQDESELYSFISQAKDQGIKLSIFREPDIDNAITAIALEPGEKSKVLCSNLRLALKDMQ